MSPLASITRCFGIVVVAGAIAGAGLLAQGGGQEGGSAPALIGRGVTTLGTKPIPIAGSNAMNNPYRMLENWPTLGDIKSGAASGIVPDGKGGVWLQHRSDPGIIHFDASGKIIKSFPVTFATAHGMCQDSDGNFWALDSGPFNDTPGVTGVRGNQVFKFDQNGKLLLTIGKAGDGHAGHDSFIQPVACAQAPDGTMVFADGHWPRPKVSQQDGDRLVWFTKDGKYVKEFGKQGTAPGEFYGPHGVAYDSQGRLFVADRSNNRVQIFDKDMKYVDSWQQFGRPSQIVILKDDTLLVADSDSNRPNGGETIVPNPGWRTGIRIGSAKDGSLRMFIDGTQPEGLGADEAGNVWGGLIGGCNTSKSGGCLQKFVKK